MLYPQITEKQSTFSRYPMGLKTGCCLSLIPAVCPIFFVTSFPLAIFALRNFDVGKETQSETLIVHERYDEKEEFADTQCQSASQGKHLADGGNDKDRSLAAGS